jgi:hypothetical protein
MYLSVTFVTGADTAMVRALELILQAKLERRKLKGFDYTVPVAPDTKYSSAPHRLQRSIV